MWDFNSKDVYRFHDFYIPARMMDGLQRYIENHVPPGSFLSSVIKNDLKNTVGYADDENILNLPAYIIFLHNQAPNNCWGSTELFNQWIADKKGEEK